MRVAITSISCALVAIVACTGGAGSPNNLRGGPDGIPSSSTDSPGSGGYDNPGNSNQDPPGNSNQDSPGGSSSSSSCLTCSGVYACVIPDSDGGTALIGLTPGSNGCDVIDSQGGSSSGTLACGGAVEITGDTSGIVETWSGGNASFTISATQNGQTLTISCVASSQTLPTSSSNVGTTIDGGS